MNLRNTSYWRKKATVAFMLLSLLVQVQTVFACHMMDISGPVEQCCCDDEPVVNKSVDADQFNDSGCCDISSELVLTGADLDDKWVTIQSQPALEFPSIISGYSNIHLWPDTTGPPVSHSFSAFHIVPASSGTHTYLSTRRLRI